MKKKLLLVLAVLVLAVATYLLIGGPDAPAPTQYGVNLLHNADFEIVTGEGLPENWVPDAYNRIPGLTQFEVVEGVEGKGVLIVSRQGNDARYSQKVSVEADTLYELSGYVRTNAQFGRGANLSLADVYSGSDGVLDTRGEWEHFTVYGRTDRNQTELTVYARLGGYSAESQGEAAFDQLRLVALQSAPGGAQVENWATYNPQEPGRKAVSTGEKPAWPWLLIVCLMYILFAVWLAKRAETLELSPVIDNKSGTMTKLVLLLLFSAGSRLLLAMIVPGYDVDIGCFTSWADRMDQVGPLDFYMTEAHSDYPPGYMLVLWPLGAIGRMLGTGATGLIVKIPALLTDMGSIALVYAFASRHMKRHSALYLTALVAVNPLSYVTGPAWGQADSVPALLIMLVILFAFRHQWSMALPMYVLAVLMKPQALMFGPLGLAALIMDLLQKPREGKLKSALIGTAASLLLALAVVLPFSPKQESWNWLLELYGGTMGYYGYATVNATNLPFLFGLNWQPVSESAPFQLRILGSLCLVVPALHYLFLRKEGPGSSLERLALLAGVLPAAAVAALPMSLSTTGALLMLSSFLIVLATYLARGQLRQLPLLGAVLLILFCNLGVMMHERYLYPALLLLGMAYVLRRDRKILLLFLACSAITFMNVGIVLDRAIRIGGVPGHLESPLFGIASDSAWLEYLLSALHTLLAAFALHIGLTQSDDERSITGLKPLRALPAGSETAGTTSSAALRRVLNPEPAPQLQKRDYVLMLGVTLLYAALALSNLGSTTAPQRAWVSQNEDEEVLLDLGSQRDFTLLYYPGIHWADSSFEVSVSTDMQTWQTEPAQLEIGSLFAWKYQMASYLSQDGERNFSAQPLQHSGRYVTLRAIRFGTTLYEVQFRDAETGETIRPKLLTPGAEALLDEQDTMRGEPDWRNSMYFDEIYHARTAYEHLNAIRGLEPSTTYEVSHPPLGKVLMSISLMVFGMTPFGWRFAGALAGVLMLPGLYLLGMRLTRRRVFALAAMLLIAFDTMHFTQTRIATIDSFVTLFIIWSYYYMFRFSMEDTHYRPLKKTLRMLFLSGLFMGMGIASKWTGIYAAAGLAAIFFTALWRKAKEGMAAEEALESLVADGCKEEELARLRSAAGWRKRTLQTLVACVPFFVLFPALIYYWSFLPWFMRTPGGLSLKKVLDANAYMLSYHAEPGRGMDHYYYSPWYQWPIIYKPMWFYSGKTIDGTGSTIMSFGNPAIWWGGIIGLACVCANWISSKFSPSNRTVEEERHQFGLLVLVIAFLAQYLPWVLVPRGTYIYHFFPAVPFVVLCLVMVLFGAAQWKARAGRILLIAVLVISGLLFVAFFPYASGVRVSTAWLDLMKWFPNWLYY